MFNKYIGIFFIGVITFCNSCISPPDYPIEPVITFKGMTKNKMAQSQFGKDSLSITFSFTDGDGDIGSNDTTLNISLIDTRDGFNASNYKIPYIPEQGSGNGISGEIQIVVFTTCCYYPDGSNPCAPSTTYPTDTLQYDIYITDRAGHKSNIIRTDPIILDCTKF